MGRMKTGKFAKFKVPLMPKPQVKIFPRIRTNIA